MGQHLYLVWSYVIGVCVSRLDLSQLSHPPSAYPHSFLLTAIISQLLKQLAAHIILFHDHRGKRGGGKYACIMADMSPDKGMQCVHEYYSSNSGPAPVYRVLD